jgi:hypothetical protein
MSPYRSASSQSTRSATYGGPIISKRRARLHDYIGGCGTRLAENIGPFGTALCENETTLRENSPITSAANHIGENGFDGGVKVRNSGGCVLKEHAGSRPHDFADLVRMADETVHS